MGLSMVQKDVAQMVLKTIPVKTTNSHMPGFDLVQGGSLPCVTDYYPKWLYEAVQKAAKALEFARYLRAQNVGVQRTGMTFRD